MANYPGMSLGGEVRESVSLDEDDLSDVEDEVFIRDGKNGYKFAEDVGVKRPLMAPRRKSARSDFTSRIKNRHQCKSFCKPCCYAFGALVVLIGLIVLVVIVVSMFPLPLDKLKNWIIAKTTDQFADKILPCNDVTVTDVWTVNLPKLTSESFIRAVDVNMDGVDDIIFGFGTGDNYNMNPDIFCPMFLDVQPPCGGGVMAMNGTNGDVLWRRWLPHTVYTITCTVDINEDGIFDCLATGKGGILCAIDSKNGSVIWQFDNKLNPQQPLTLDIYMASFVPDQDNDGVNDVLTAHTSVTDVEKTGHLILLSGRTGVEIQRMSTPGGVETYYTPQILYGEVNLVVFGTGSPIAPGNLSVVPLSDITNGYVGNITTLHRDASRGVLSSSILVDITGDNVTDIVVSLFNSTTIAIDGKNFTQLWNFTVPESETLSVPTPGYFNDDNVTDFLIKYQTGPGFPVYYYSQIYILDGATGRPIYDAPIVDSVGSQMGGLTLSMENRGFDWFLFWQVDCKNFEGQRDMYEFISGSTAKQQNRADICKLRFNSTAVAKLHALNQFEQPPGVEIYSSDKRAALEYDGTKSPLEEAEEYFKGHPEMQQAVPITEPAKETKIVKHKDAFRHKSSNPYVNADRGKNIDALNQPKYDQEYDQMEENWRSKLSQYPENEDVDRYNDYADEPVNLYNPDKQLRTDKTPNRDTRSKDDTTENGDIYSYRNIKNSRNRLLHDVNELPTEILRDTYFKTRERQLRKSRFEQRDLLAHRDKIKENEEVRKVIEDERRNFGNVSENLWDLESEKEKEDRENGYYRGKREVNGSINGIPRITSVGTLIKSNRSDSIDFVFLTYWLPPVNGAQLLLEKDVQCITDKIRKALNSKEQILNYEKTTLEDLFKKECIEERFKVQKSTTTAKTAAKDNFPYYNQIAHLNLGQMTVYRVRIGCKCQSTRKAEKCSRFLDVDDQRWPSHLGKSGDGAFVTSP